VKADEVLASAMLDGSERPVNICGCRESSDKGWVRFDILEAITCHWIRRMVLLEYIV